VATKAIYNASIPHDEHLEVRPGVKLIEADIPGSAKWMAISPEHPERAKKGDLGFGGLRPPRESFESPLAGVPFKNLRKR
jgi:hypothetical protein